MRRRKKRRDGGEKQNRTFSPLLKYDGAHTERERERCQRAIVNEREGNKKPIGIGGGDTRSQYGQGRRIRRCEHER